MQDIKDIYADIKTKIKKHTDEPAFIYTGVGTAAGMRNANGGLDAENYHQYPPLIQQIKKTIPALHLYIVLIDPLQEQPPYMLHDILSDFSNDMGADNTNTINTNCKDAPTLYSDKAKKIHIYTLPKYVTMAPYHDPMSPVTYDATRTDITDDLRDLNLFAMTEPNVTTFYHDFTGRRNDILAEYFDETMYPADLDHIVYGLSTREDHGCYFDLSAPNAFMPFRLLKEKEKNRVTFFNIFKYIRSEKMEIQKTDIYPSADDGYLIELQRESVLLQIKNDFKNNIFTTMRVLLKLIRGEEKKADIMNIYIFAFVPYNKRAHLEEKFKNECYREIFDYLMDFFSKKMDIVVKLKEYDFTGRELMGFIINEYEKNLYKWIDTLNYFIPS